MNIELSTILIIVFCVSGAAWHAWATGFKRGAASAIDALVESNIIRYNDNEDIIPNCPHVGELDLITRINNALILDDDEIEEETKE